MGKKCILTAKDDVKVTSSGWIVNGERRENLDNCTLKPGTTFTMLVEDIPNTPKRSKPNAPSIHVEHIPAPPPSQEASPAASQPQPQAQSLQLPPELQEVRELMELYQSAQGFGPYVAILLVAYVGWQKLNKKNQQGCQQCQERERLHHRVHHDPATCPQCISERHSQEAAHPLDAPN
jgi:hypothetical protein